VVSVWFADGKTRGGGGAVPTSIPKETLSLRNSEPRNNGNDLLRAQ
jgi:hypothetical protein